VIAPFSITCLPRIVFGEGVLSQTPGLASEFGRRALLITGGQSFGETPAYQDLASGLTSAGMVWDEIPVSAEPSPQLVDDIVLAQFGRDIDVVIGVGGGSVLDAAKAVAGLLPHGNSVMDHLEGVGPEKPFVGPAIPFIAVPTTAGTGSEATKNAVLSVRGKNGFKKSFRHDLLVPRYAVVDPLLLASCPPRLVAANGMDALTQLLESLVSTRANPFTDSLAWSGLEAVRDSLLEWYEQGEQARSARTGMAYAALLSGITLAQVGLGSVHGLAAPLGAYFPIPHGVACGTLVAVATEMNIRALRERQPESPALEKYANAGRLLGRDDKLPRELAWQRLVEVLGDWTRRMDLARLRDYGMQEAGIDVVVRNSRGSSMKTNPVVLTDAEIAEVLRARL